MGRIIDGFVYFTASIYCCPLILHKIYRILPDEDAAADDDIRVVDESGEDYLFSTSCLLFNEANH
ncbi:MAG: hypothetical protein GY757_25530 [bacterium]|nr:hypothetical protein [bacterium]